MNDDLIGKVTELFKVYPQPRGFDPETVALYVKHLSVMPADAICEAIDRLISTSRFMPTIAEIKEAAVLGPYALLPDDAWVEVKREARRVGFNRPLVFQGGQFLPREMPTFSSPLIAAAADAVGWELICTGDDTKGFIRDQFIKAYRAVRERELKAVQSGLVPFEVPALPPMSAESEDGDD